MSFVPPSQFEANRINPGDSVCEGLAKLFRQVNLTAEQQAAIYQEDGSFTTEFIAKLCATGCGGGGGDTNTSTPDPDSDATAYLSNRFVSGGVYHGRLFSINSGDWTYNTISGDMTQVLIGMAVNPLDSTLWAVYFDETNDTSPYPLRLGQVNTTTGVVTYVATINSSGSDWSSATPDDYYCLEFKPNGILLMGYWSRTGGGVVNDSQIYTVNTTTGELTQIGTALFSVGFGSRYAPYSLAYDTLGVLHVLGFDVPTSSITTGTVNLTPNPANANAIEATVDCTLVSLGSAPAPDSRPFVSLLSKNLARQAAARGTADIYEVEDDATGCLTPSILRMTGAASMANVVAVAGKPS